MCPSRWDPKNALEIKAETEGFDLFTSLRYDPLLLHSDENSTLSASPGKPTAFYMLRNHRDRLLEASRHFQWETTTSLLEGDDGLAWLDEALTKELTAWSKGEEACKPLKVRSPRS